jgi:hypothetical protein
MRIGLVGAPGAGKSELAVALADEIALRDLQCEDCRTPIRVIDNYVGDIGNEADQVVGFSASYLANLYIHLGRYARERHAVKDGAKTIITCGTMLETATYVALYAVRHRMFDKDNPHAQDNLTRIDATMRMLATLYMDTFNYDHLFYLPVVTDDEMVKQLDKDLQAAFQAFYLQPVTPLITQKVEVRVGQVMDAIDKTRERDDVTAAAGLSE